MAGHKYYWSIKEHKKEAQNLHQLKSPISDPNILSKSTTKCTKPGRTFLIHFQKWFLNKIFTRIKIARKFKFYVKIIMKGRFQWMLSLILISHWWCGTICHQPFTFKILFRLALAILWVVFENIQSCQKWKD